MKRKHRLASGCAAALVTCWAAAPTTAEAQLVVPVPNSADFTLSTDLTVAIDNVRFIYGFNASGFQNPFFVSVGSILAGPQSQTLTLQNPNNGEDIFPDQLTWALIGTHGTDGVALAASSSFLDFPPDPNTWDGYFGGSPLKPVVREAVVEGDEGALTDFFANNFFDGILNETSVDPTIYNFSDITVNGSMDLTLVPEPSTYSFLVGMAAFSCILVRRSLHRS